MNKKLISIILIFGLLSVSFTGVMANQTVDDVQTESADESQDLTTTDVEETPEVTSTAENEIQEDDNSTDNSTDNNTANDSAVMTSDEKSESINAVSKGLDDLTDTESLKFYDELRNANTNGQYDEILNMLDNYYNYTPDDFADAFSKLSDEDYNALSEIFEFSHDIYNSESSQDRANKTIDILDDIMDLDVENGEDFVEILKFFNDGKFDNILDILENSESYTLFDLYHEISLLSDEDFEAFNSFIQLLDMYDGDDEVDIVSIFNSNSNAKTGADGGNGHSTGTVSSKISKYSGQKIFKEHKITSFSPSKIGLIRLLLSKYFDGEITFDQLVDLLNKEDIDTSDLKQNPDGSLSWFGLDSILFGDNPTDDDDMDISDDSTDTDDDDEQSADASDNADSSSAGNSHQSDSQSDDEAQSNDNSQQEE